MQNLNVDCHCKDSSLLALTLRSTILQLNPGPVNSTSAPQPSTNITHQPTWGYKTSKGHRPTMSLTCDEQKFIAQLCFALHKGKHGYGNDANIPANGKESDYGTLYRMATIAVPARPEPSTRTGYLFAPVISRVSLPLPAAICSVHCHSNSGTAGHSSTLKHCDM
jgi:hypothetical protein